jgi:hypothetical protein
MKISRALSPSSKPSLGPALMNMELYFNLSSLPIVYNGSCTGSEIPSGVLVGGRGAGGVDGLGSPGTEKPLRTHSGPGEEIACSLTGKPLCALPISLRAISNC